MGGCGLHFLVCFFFTKSLVWLCFLDATTLTYDATCDLVILSVGFFMGLHYWSRFEIWILKELSVNCLSARKFLREFSGLKPVIFWLVENTDGWFSFVSDVLSDHREDIVYQVLDKDSLVSVCFITSREPVGSLCVLGHVPSGKLLEPSCV